MTYAQDRDHVQADHDRTQGGRARDNRADEQAYLNNKYYKQGWQDGQKHKHKKFRNDDDGRA